MSASIQPELAVRGGPAAVVFYKEAFGAVELYRVGDQSIVAQLSIGGANLWVADEAPGNRNLSPETADGCTVRLLLIVDDPEAVAARAIAAGAEELSPVAEEHGWPPTGPRI